MNIFLRLALTCLTAVIIVGPVHSKWTNIVSPRHAEVGINGENADYQKVWGKLITDNFSKANYKSADQMNEKHNDTLKSFLKKQIAILRLQPSSLALFTLIVISLALGTIIRYQVKSKAIHMILLRENMSELESRACEIEQLQVEKDWLIREIHHRVKNNLQVAVSLLNTQSAYLKDEEALDAIRNSQHRMFSISLVHQKLYQSESISRIDIPIYINELVSYIRDAYDPEHSIHVELKTDPLLMDVSLAVPFGLILNEVLSNSLKHAFPEKKGKIMLSLKSLEGDDYLLELADNGIGMDSEEKLRESNSLGATLLTGLSKQLRARLAIKIDNGMRISLAFRNIDIQKNSLPAV